MNIYVASSWRNEMQPDVVRALREDGHEVYDFREPAPGDSGFSWHRVDPTVPPGPADLRLPAQRIIDMLEHHKSYAGFRTDMGALEWCDACVLVLPCGRSAHLEAGWAVGAGRLTIGILADGEPDLMWKMLDYLVADLDNARALLQDAEL